MNSFLKFTDDIQKSCNNILAYPADYIEKFFENTPLVERYMLPFFIYLPLKDKDIEEKYVNIATAFYLVDLAFKVHSRVSEDDNISDKFNVLAGDLLHSSGFVFFCKSLAAADVQDCVDVFLKQSTAWFMWHNGDDDIRENAEKYLPPLNEEYCSKFVKAGEFALDGSDYDDKDKDDYLELCRLASLTWGAKVKGCAFDYEANLAEIRQIGERLNLNDELTPFYALF